MMWGIPGRWGGSSVDGVGESGGSETSSPGRGRVAIRVSLLVVVSVGGGTVLVAVAAELLIAEETASVRRLETEVGLQNSRSMEDMLIRIFRISTASRKLDKPEKIIEKV